MQVRVDDPWNDGATVRIDDLRCGAALLQHLTLAADGQHASTGNCYRGRSLAREGHRVDACVVNHQIGHLRRPLLGRHGRVPSFACAPRIFFAY